MCVFVSFCCFYRQYVINNSTGNVHMTSDQLKMQAMMTNCLVIKMPIQFVTSAPPLNSSAQKNHSSGSLTLMNIKIRYVEDLVVLVSQATISFSKQRIWNDLIMGPSVVVKILVPYKAQVIQKMDSHDS